MSGNEWIDLPIIEALDYFQGIAAYFMNFAVQYSWLIGLVGLIWTAFKLIPEAIYVLPGGILFPNGLFLFFL